MVDFKQETRHYCHNTCPAMPSCPPISAGRRKKASGRGLSKLLFGAVLCGFFVIAVPKAQSQVVGPSPCGLMRLARNVAIDEREMQPSLFASSFQRSGDGVVRFLSNWNTKCVVSVSFENQKLLRDIGEGHWSLIFRESLLSGHLVHQSRGSPVVFNGSLQHNLAWHSSALIFRSRTVSNCGCDLTDKDSRPFRINESINRPSRIFSGAFGRVSGFVSGLVSQQKHVTLESRDQNQDTSKPSENLRIISDRLGSNILYCFIFGCLCGAFYCLVVWRLCRRPSNQPRKTD
jgi:hypothetical protein